MDKDDKRVLLFAGTVTIVLFTAALWGDIKGALFPQETTQCDAACQAEMDRLTREIVDRFHKDIDQMVEDAIDEAKR